MANQSDHIGDKITERGQVAGPLLRSPLFIPHGISLVFEADNGTFWQLALAQNANGSTYYGEDGKPTIELLQVTP